MTTTISSKGQITIPIEIRKRLGLREGDRVEFVAHGGLTVVRPVRTVTNPFEAFIGALGTFPGGINDINAWVANLRDEPESHA